MAKMLTDRNIVNRLRRCKQGGSRVGMNRDGEISLHESIVLCRYCLFPDVCYNSVVSSRSIWWIYGGNTSAPNLSLNFLAAALSSSVHILQQRSQISKLVDFRK